MDKHLLTEIEIKDFKCFKDFKADGFKRVNLIGGKNNVGKTAFMEACFLIANSYNMLKSQKTPIDREIVYFEIIKLLLIIEQNRSPKDFLLEWLKEEFNFKDYTFDIEINKQFHLYCKDNFLSPDEFQKQNYWNHGSVDISNFRSNTYYNKIYKKNHQPLLNDYTFISSQNNMNEAIRDMVDELKLIGKYDYINGLMKDIFNIEKIDIIKNRVMLQQSGRFLELSNFGDGLKSFFYIIIVLLTHKEKIVFIDEIENGIHYSLLDDLWEIVLKTSKEQNVQVFAITHSKECIESYARVAKKLEDKEICYIKMSRLKDGSIKAGVRDYDMLQDSIDDDHEVRGW
ncbi:MAG: AAA family ATPase [Sulfurimonas sp.]|uniref:AAA family ATPase n=1 Tax=Sulfurimonas sp. TaxID=2022749 RepID=UPI0026232788|nr:AAA family ATPase [Sulfurimonas sp.]MDD5372940.1 AAA family ATPase [Sulfurimonas sp.]